MKEIKKNLLRGKRLNRYPHVIAVRVNDSIKEWLNIQAYRLNMYPAEIIRDILTEHIKNRKSKNIKANQIAAKLWD